MTLPYADQSADNLRLTLANGDLDTTQFSVLAEASLCLPGAGLVRAGIIGASHFLSFERGERFHEVFACMTDVRAETVRDRIPLPTLLKAPVELSSPRYRFEARMRAWHDGIAERDDLLAAICSSQGADGEIGLSFAFPDPPDVAAAYRGGALTAVWLRMHGSRITVRTLHAYPASTMVFTTSALE